MIGKSFSQLIKNKVVTPPAKYFAVELHNQAAFIEDGWKLRRLVPAGNEAKMAPWELFNLALDPLETKNLAGYKSDKLKDLEDKYENFAGKTMVIPAEGKKLPYQGYDDKTGKYIGLDKYNLK